MNLALWALVGAVLATGVGLLLAVSAPAAPPALSLTATDAGIGGTIHASAQLSESPEASGAISFEVFGPGDPSCSGPALSPAPASASVDHGEGEYASGDFTPPSAGSYSWSAHYSGDETNPPADSTCSATSTVSKASPGLTGSASDGAVGTAIHDEVTVTGGFSPGGEVSFSIYGPTDTGCSLALATTSASIQGGHATSPDFAPQQAGTFRWTATYPGDANNEAFSLTCNAADQASTVSKVAPTLSGTATGTIQVGQTITDSINLAGGFNAGGELVFSAFGPNDSNCLGAVKYEKAVPVSGDGSYSPPGFTPAPGTYRWTVAYAGDGNNEPTGLACNGTNQTSTVDKASPGLTGSASPATVGAAIHDEVTVTGGFSPGGEVTFSLYGPTDNPSCSGSSQYDEVVTVNGDGTYSPPGFAPAAGRYQWTVNYEGDGNNDVVALPCGTANQASAVGTIPVTLVASATGGTVGTPVMATAALQEGAIPGGQITFRAFPPSDGNCTGPAAFSSVVAVAGNGSYSSAPFVPARVGTFRWTMAYSGDVNHAPTTAGCGKAVSNITQASPSIAGQVQQKVTVGTSFRDTATLQGGYLPGGTVTFRIYGPVASGCAKPVFVDTVAITGNGSVSSDPFVAKATGRYSFLASYSGDASNHSATEPCDSPSQVTQVLKRTPKVKPRAALVGHKLISIRARLSGGVSPSGAINFHLYGPGDKRCKRKPAFSGAVTVKANGTYSLANYLATKPGLYRLSVGYSGDPRNQRYKGGCGSAQSIRVG